MKPITSLGDLRALRNWVVFAQVPQPDGSKPRKVPFDPGTNTVARVNDPRTWRSHAEACADAERTGRHPGIALTPAMGLTLIDIDDQSDHRLIAALASYTERSVSGNGLHVLCRGRPPENFVAPPGVEIYPRTGNRFVLLTGDIIDGRTTIEDRTELLAKLFPAAAIAPLPSTPLTLDDDELLARAFGASNGADLERLLAGDLNGHGNDHSAADLAAASKLAFWTQDEAQICRIIGASALGRREKWQKRPDYQRRTVARALKRTTFYSAPATIIRPGTTDRPAMAAIDPAAPCAERVAQLERLLSERDATIAAQAATIAERDATITALTQTILNPHLSHTEKIAAVSIARHADAKRAGGQVEPDGRVVLSASEVADDWRPKPEPRGHITPVNPDSGTAPHMPRSSARGVLDAALERELLEGEKRGTVRRRADGSTYKDWEYVVSPAASFADLLNPWASWRPEQPKVRKVRESRACPQCNEVHPITRIDYCAGCGGELNRQTIEAPPMEEIISPIRGVAQERYGRKFFSHGTPGTPSADPPWLMDDPDPWDSPPQPSLFPPDDPPPGQSFHFSAD